jgi:hypothetical protein
VVTLFDSPNGWTVTESTLAELMSITRYTVSSGSIQGKEASTSFTLRDLDGLGDSVWTRRGGSFVAMAKSDFEKAAFDEC